MKCFLLAILAVVLLLRHSIQAQDVPVLSIPNAPVQGAQGAPVAIQNWVAPQNPFGLTAQGTQVIFGNVVPAKIDLEDGRRQIIFMLEAFRSEIQELPVTTIKSETRKRLVNQPDGKVIEQEFTVQVPITIMQSVDRRVSVGVKPSVWALDDFQFFTPDAKPVPTEDAAKIISTLKPVFLLDRFAGEIQPFGANEQQVLRPDVLVVVTKKVVRIGGTRILSTPRAAAIRE